ncbi:uncharacterized protein LOC116616695, partial [Nematostella vectensis]|uniref:uncharacterized protein LOC116616695 n=1 Tax=Nematostella vectensis TaxID=45351 RepID=UPI0020776304
ATAFNTTLITPTNSSPSRNTAELNANDNDDEIPVVSTKDPDFYDSEQWANYVDSILEGIAVPQPSQTPQSTTPNQTSASTRQQSHSNQQHAATSAINRTFKITTLNVSGCKIWLFENSISQSTLNGRNGSNACTFIAIILAKTVISNLGTLAFPIAQLSPVWGVIMCNCISHGNRVHQQVTGGQAIYFSVQDAAVHLSSIGTIMVEDSFDVDFVCQNPQVPQSSLRFYLQRLVREPNIAAIVIINGLSVCFLGRGNEVLLLDSHLHGTFGALVGKAALQDIDQYLTICKQWLSPNVIMCTVTFISFV